MANYKEQMQHIFGAYMDKVGSEPVSLDAVAEWAITEGMFSPTPRSVLKLCREALADSLREEKRLDSDGRLYRAKHSVRQSIGGVQLVLWADIDSAPRVFMEKSFSQRRKAIANDCYQVKQDVDHFNSARAAGRPIQMILDFTDDVAEMEAARDLDDKAA
ncbi:hypothetical protein [Sphingomonas endolithica]|uniref:hypothetical protein n=1 Tax=Sphingomonas endolithica TaxID=2972485 RepID=UPI0021AF2FA7|nr:hypothetical protein [Sphingomonas sp. ZFBP2030]